MMTVTLTPARKPFTISPEFGIEQRAPVWVEADVLGTSLAGLLSIAVFQMPLRNGAVGRYI
jgi:hypothetical protein